MRIILAKYVSSINNNCLSEKSIGFLELHKPNLLKYMKLSVCKTDGIKKCKAGSISLRLFKLKQIEVNNGQKTIDIRPRTRYNISNLIRKQCYHYCIAK